MPAKSAKELRVYQKAYALAVEIFEQDARYVVESLFVLDLIEQK